MRVHDAAVGASPGEKSNPALSNAFGLNPNLHLKSYSYKSNKDDAGRVPPPLLACDLNSGGVAVFHPGRFFGGLNSVESK